MDDNHTQICAQCGEEIRPWHQTPVDPQPTCRNGRAESTAAKINPFTCQHCGRKLAANPTDIPYECRINRDSLMSPSERAMAPPEEPIHAGPPDTSRICAQCGEEIPPRYGIDGDPHTTCRRAVEVRKTATGGGPPDVPSFSLGVAEGKAWEREEHTGNTLFKDGYDAGYKAGYRAAKAEYRQFAAESRESAAQAAAYADVDFTKSDFTAA